MAAITICSDFGAPKNKVWNCFHCFPVYFSWSDGTWCHDLSFRFCPIISIKSSDVPGLVTAHLSDFIWLDSLPPLVELFLSQVLMSLSLLFSVWTLCLEHSSKEFTPSIVAQPLLSHHSTSNSLLLLLLVYCDSLAATRVWLHESRELVILFHSCICCTWIRV